MIPILNKISHWISWKLGNIFLSFFFKFEIKGRENLKDLGGPLIIVYNHCSMLDPFVVMASIPSSSKIAPIHFAVWYKHFYKLYFFPFLLLSGAFPVKQGVGLEEALKSAIKVLNNNGTVGIAPEGKRRHFGRPRKGRRGSAFLALKTNSPLLPFYIEGTLGLSPSEFFLRKRKITLVIGKPFCLPQQKITKPEDLDAPADFIRDKTFELEEKL